MDSTAIYYDYHHANIVCVSKIFAYILLKVQYAKTLIVIYKLSPSKKSFYLLQ